jgi:hypothetical protein
LNRLTPALQFSEDDEGGGKRGVTTKIDLMAWRKPANMKLAFLWDEESGFGKVIFLSYGLQGGIVKPVFKWADGGWVAAKYPA